LRLQRGTATLDVPVKVVERRDDPNRFAALLTPDTHVIARLGILGLEFTREMEDLLPDLRSDSGVVVASTTREMPPAWEGELEPGDLIHGINGVPIKTLVDLRQHVDALAPNAALVLQIERDGTMMYVAARIQ
jgi:serine protease Do